MKNLFLALILLASPAIFAQIQPLTCSGSAIAPGGMMCDANGTGYYQHYHWSIAMRADGHGTFAAATETGIWAPGTYEIIVYFPQSINIREIHGNLNIISWCSSNGIVTDWQGADTNGPIENLVWEKFGTINQLSFAEPIKADFPIPVPLKEMYMYVNNDLGACSTVNWAISGSF